MPSLRKRAHKVDPSPAAMPMADGGPIPQSVVDAALADAKRVVDSVPPIEAETAPTPAPASPETAAAPTETPAQDSSMLLAQLQALRNAELATQRQAEISAAMSRDTVPAQSSAQATPPQAPIEFTPAEIGLNQSHGVMGDPAIAQIASVAVGVLAQRGIVRGTPQYETELRPAFEQLLADARQPAAPSPVPAMTPPVEEPPEPEERRIPVSAPVSRTIASGDFSPSLTGKVTLSPQEREHARLAGISEVEFAKQKLKLQQLKASGFYAEQDR